MNRRIVAAVVAGILALLGAVILVGYVNGAEERALADLDPVAVLVVTAPITQGTPAEEIAASVATNQLPVTAVGPGAVADLARLSGLVAITDLEPGEQVLAGRFASPQELVKFGGIPVPEGVHQVTIPLDSPRVVGGTVTPGDLVGVFVSLSDGRTHLILHKILVLRVEGGKTPAAAEGAAADPDAAAKSSEGTTVTLALNAPDAEKVVFGTEHGTVWLSLVDPTTPEGGTRIVDPGNIYE